MQIFHVVEALGEGGVTTVVLDLAKRQIADGHDVQVIELKPGGWRQRALQNGIRVQTGLRQATFAILTNRSAIIHCHQRRCGLLAVALGRRIRTIEHVHNVFADKKFTSFHGRHIVAVSQHIEQNLLENYPHTRGKTQTILNGVPSRAPQMPQARDQFSIITCGRLEHQKNPFYYIGIINELTAMDARYRFTWVGDGSLRETFLRTLQETPAWTSFTHHRELEPEGVYKLMTGSRATLMTSAWEGFPMVGLESLSTGTPVLTTDVGDFSSIVQDNSLGMVFPSEAPGLAAKKIHNDLQHPLSLETSARLAAWFNANLSLDVADQRWGELYKKVL